MRTLTIRLLLCLLLINGVKATPLTSQDIEQGQKKQTNTAKSNDNTQPASKGVESGEAPTFVRLADGRIVPFGPGVICTEDCVDTESFLPEAQRLPGIRGLNPWVIGIPLIAGGIIACAVLCRGDEPIAVLTTSTPGIVTPPPPIDVPEPATLVLLGLGLAMVARHGFGKKKSAEKPD